MFPIPVAKTPLTQWLYAAALPIALFLWLLPLLGVALTSVRPASDLAQGNYFGMPSTFAWNNYVDIFLNTPLWKYIRNSFIVTIPTVIGTSVSCPAWPGAVPAIYKFKSNLLLFFMFVAGNFVPFQIPRSRARPDGADGPLQQLHRPDPVPHRLPDPRHPSMLHVKFHQVASGGTD